MRSLSDVSVTATVQMTYPIYLIFSQSRTLTVFSYVTRTLHMLLSQHTFNIPIIWETTQLCINQKEYSQLKYRHFIIRQLYKYFYWLYVYVIVCFIVELFSVNFYYTNIVSIIVYKGVLWWSPDLFSKGKLLRSSWHLFRLAFALPL